MVTQDAKSGVKPILLGASLAAIIGAIVFALLPAPDASLSVTAPATQNVSPEVQTDVVDATSSAPSITAETPVLSQGPAFDTFRVGTDGNMVIAGRAEPGEVIDVMLGDTAIDRVTADASGNFVALPFAGPSAQPRRLLLVADPEGAAIASETSYIVAPITAPADPDVAVAAVDAPEGPATDIEQAPVADVTATAPPVVLQTDEDGVRVVQGGPAPTDPNVALDAITYDPQGEVQLSGRAAGDGAVQIYLDNEPLTTSPVTGGDWRIDLPQIDTGIYTLRIDEVDAGGEVVSRLETPFKREEPADVAAVLAEETSADGFEVAVRTVQPGATLWAIAEENLGSGVYYVAVFEANADLIRDPDLIYPGQIFRIPDVTE